MESPELGALVVGPATPSFFDAGKGREEGSLHMSSSFVVFGTWQLRQLVSALEDSWTDMKRNAYADPFLAGDQNRTLMRQMPWVVAGHLTQSLAYRVSVPVLLQLLYHFRRVYYTS